jgi:hypothetical protein
MPPIYVFGEQDNDKTAACMLSYAEVVEAAKSAFRYNRIQIAAKEDYLEDRALQAYVNINAIDVRRGGQSTGSCAVNVGFSVGSYTTILNPVTKSKHFGEVIFCSPGTLFVWRKEDVAQQVKETIRDYVNECVSRYAELQR